jgi:hypothetical protein
MCEARRRHAVPGTDEALEGFPSRGVLTVDESTRTSDRVIGSAEVVV